MSSTTKNMGWGDYRGTILCYHTDTDPTDEEWELFVDHQTRVVAKKHERSALICVTDGGMPNAKQRAYLLSRLMDVSDSYRALRMLVFVDSVLVLGVLTAFRWFGATRIQAHPVDQLHPSLIAAGYSRADAAEIICKLQEIQLKLAKTSYNDAIRKGG